MKVKVQLFTCKGYYGPEITTESIIIGEIGQAIIEAIEQLPEELEGEGVVDWTRMKIEVER